MVECCAGCSLVQEAFITECTCLQRNAECDEHCVCHTTGRCLNRAVQLHQGLQVGSDVQEIDSWGYDSYTRKNIHDGEELLETVSSDFWEVTMGFNHGLLSWSIGLVTHSGVFIGLICLS